MALRPDRLSPVEQAMRTHRRLRWLVIILIALALAYYFIFANEYVVAYESPPDHFKYGSIGSEAASGLPTKVLLALPALYRDKLGPDGYRQFGFLYEDDNPLPIGFSRRIVDGVERAWLNCSVCHVGTYRLPGAQERELILGAPSNNLRLRSFILFLLEAGRDPNFTADRLIETINSDDVPASLNWFEQVIYRIIVFPRLKQELASLGTRLAFVERQHDWGPWPRGYLQSLQGPAVQLSNGPRGHQRRCVERLLRLSIALDAGAARGHEPALGRKQRFRRRTQSQRGAGRRCHAGHRRPGLHCPHRGMDVGPETAPLPRTGTRSTKHRPNAVPRFTPAIAPIAMGKARRTATITTPAGTNASDRWCRWTTSTPIPAAGSPIHRISPAHRTCSMPAIPGGFTGSVRPAAMPITRLTGSGRARPICTTVPFRPCAISWNRRQTGRGSGTGAATNSISKKVGYRSDRAAPGALFRFDTSVQGNSRSGHEGTAYGTHLPDADKDAIVEYMKTL